jgi:hypothetical protein
MMEMDGREFLRRLLGGDIANNEATDPAKMAKERLDRWKQHRDSHMQKAAKLDRLIEFAEAHPDAFKFMELSEEACFSNE